MIIDNLFLRQMTKEDLSFVNSTRNISSTRKWLENNNEISLEDTKKWFLKNKPNWHVIFFKEKPVGYIRTSDDTKKSICVGCDIHPNFRRKGIARKSYSIFLESLYEEGYVNIWLDVFKENEPAYKLYESLGFIPIGSRIVREKIYVTMVHKRGEKIE